MRILIAAIDVWTCFYVSGGTNNPKPNEEQLRLKNVTASALLMSPDRSNIRTMTRD
jgi:hypothetical protein